MDVTGVEATTWVDVSVRALVHESMLPLETLLHNAVRDKRRECPVKDADGRHVVQADFVPFIMRHMGSLDSEAHKVLEEAPEEGPQTYGAPHGRPRRATCEVDHAPPPALAWILQPAAKAAILASEASAAWQVAETARRPPRASE